MKTSCLETKTLKYIDIFVQFRESFEINENLLPSGKKNSVLYSNL